VAHPVKRPASYEDILALPDHVVGEIVDGELHVSPRPASPHATASSALGEELGPPFKRGRGGPGGWVILDEPELHLDRDVLVPDLAGWRRERMPETPQVAYFVLAPDWACEVLSPSTAMLDRTKKLVVYARELVAHVWIVDPLAQTLEVLRLDGDSYRIVLVAAAADRVRAEPFDAIELDLAILWAR
jgi:Uma2 family endonuclease